MAEDAYTIEAMCAALEQSAGVVLGASLILGCSRKTVFRYIAKHPAVAEACEEARAAVKDSAEMRLIQAINGTTTLNAGQLTAVIFYLKCHGWNDRSGQPLEPPTPPAPGERVDLSSYTLEQKRELERFLTQPQPAQSDA